MSKHPLTGENQEYEIYFDGEYIGVTRDDLIAWETLPMSKPNMIDRINKIFALVTPKTWRSVSPRFSGGNMPNITVTFLDHKKDLTF